MPHLWALKNKRDQYGANSTLKSVSKWLAVKLCPLDKWWLLAAHYLAIRAPLNWHLVPNWCWMQSDTKNTSALKWRTFDCRLASSWISIYTHTERARNVCASWHRTRVGHARTCLISAACLSKLDHSYLTSLLVCRGVGLSFPSFIPNTLWELWSLCNTSFFSCLFAFPFFIKQWTTRRGSGKMPQRSPGRGGVASSWLWVAGGLVLSGGNGQDREGSGHPGACVVPAPCWYEGMWNLTHVYAHRQAGISTGIQTQRLLRAITSESVMVSC